MKGALSPEVADGAGRFAGREKSQGKLKILQKIHKFGQKGVLERGFETFDSAKMTGMRCRSVWDTSQGLKPSKIAEK